MTGIELKERKSCLTDAGVLTYRKHMHITSNAWHKQSIARMSTIRVRHTLHIHFHLENFQ